MRFIIFVIDKQSNTATSDEMAAIDAFNDGLQENGHWITAAGIAAPSAATLIDNRNDAAVVQQGSLFDQDDFYSGFWLIQAADEVTALTLAKAGSKACNRRVELRPYLGN